MLLMVGLGNPGVQYANNRHNIGFRILDAIQAEYKFPAYISKFQGAYATGRLADQNIALLKPMTYMNLSGKSVSECIRFYKIPVENVYVFYDEIDLVLGKVKVKIGGSAAGHNGIKSLDQYIEKEYTRVRFGVDRPVGGQPVSSYVLQDFASFEKNDVQDLIHILVDELPRLVAGDKERFMSEIARRQQTK
ncbi:MAG: aminoacyl-tRNA hydrolase [Alphaproteobacteria bacterium]|nr:aminoacyl-tRNA hydrolase [Alphaproteobacteria bacterium]